MRGRRNVSRGLDERKAQLLYSRTGCSYFGSTQDASKLMSLVACVACSGSELSTLKEAMMQVLEGQLQKEMAQTRRFNKACKWRTLPHINFSVREDDVLFK